MDGGTGADKLYGGSGIDTFVIRSGDGGSSITDADTIYDFTDGSDLIGMDSLTFNQLTIEVKIANNIPINRGLPIHIRESWQATCRLIF